MIRFVRNLRPACDCLVTDDNGRYWVVSTITDRRGRLLSTTAFISDVNGHVADYNSVQGVGGRGMYRCQVMRQLEQI